MDIFGHFKHVTQITQILMIDQKCQRVEICLITT